jgi:SAM-dependent methyltransferase
VATPRQGRSALDLRRKNRAVYDHASDPVWRLIAYGPLHDGWEFINLAGQPLLDRIARQAQLGPHSRVLDLCCGQGAACRYLAERHGSAATGVDINRRQIAAARERLGPRHRHPVVSFIEADALTWRPDRQYDLALLLDALMLTPDPIRLLGCASHALADGGLLAMSTIGAGPAIDERLRRRLWDADGMVTLPLKPELQSWLSAADLDAVHVEDMTGVAIAASHTMDDATVRRREAIVAQKGEAAYRGWLETGRAYLRAFQGGALTYFVATGRRRGTAARVSKQGEDAARGAS